MVGFTARGVEVVVAVDGGEVVVGDGGDVVVVTATQRAPVRTCPGLHVRHSCAPLAEHAGEETLVRAVPPAHVHTKAARVVVGRGVVVGGGIVWGSTPPDIAAVCPNHAQV